MYSVLLVDDESWILEGLKIDVDWEKSGFKVIGTASNGVEAFEMIKTLNPDVVFTDIRMPGMNGLELIKRTRELYINTQFVIISGYAEFAYAQKALVYGVIDYCLKPFDEEEISNVLLKIKDKLDKEVGLADYEFIDLIIDGLEESLQIVSDFLLLRGLDLNEKYCVIVTMGKECLDMSCCIHFVKLKYGKCKNIFIINYDDYIKNKAFLSKQLTENDLYGVGVSRAVISSKNLKEAVEEAELASYGYFILNKKSLIEYSECDLKNVNEYIEEFKKVSRDKDIASMNEVLAKIQESFIEENLNVKHALYIFNVIMFILSRETLENDNYYQNYESLVKRYGNLPNMFEFLKEQTASFISNKVFTKDNVENEVIKQILDYINKSFYEDISIQNLSEKYYINPSYISQLFKKELGCSFTDYITGIRINYACDLIKNTNLSIQEISSKAGYNDHFYFSRLFKKVKNQTPSQYRKESAV